MLTPATVDILSFSYPIGNTPAVCLTQDLSCEQGADILLLGCGDVRNILFTTYSDVESKPRRLDVTCCDIERAVLARNVLLFSLLFDDGEEDLNDTAIWNIYYHLFLDAKSLKLLQIQSKKLSALAASIQSWHGSKYGGLLRFCDHGTLAMIREIWNSYSTSDLDENEKVDYERRFKSGIQRAVDMKVHFLGSRSLVFTGYRSAAPVSVQSIKDLPELFQHYWDHGITDRDPDSLSNAKYPNPMFASLVTDTFTLHYGTDPLLGFHLATAYAPLSPESPLRVRSSGNPHLHKVVQAARLQFRAWSKSFRRRARQNLTLRFFVGDALAFCHTLQHRMVTGGEISAHWYRSPYQLEPLVLSSEDYAKNGKAPLSFNVIDTSNLTDHAGAINVLVATSPLLENSISATLYTESLVKREESHKVLINKLFCGHLPTISTLLGLFPLAYWTNASGISSVDEDVFDTISATMGDGIESGGQMHSRLAWKRSISVSAGVPMIYQPIRFEQLDLAHILHQVYREMFQHEDMRKLFSKIDILTLQKSSNVRYHRGSFAAFLYLVKSKVRVDWDKMMETLLDLVKNDLAIMMGSNYFQELYLNLFLLGLHSMPTIEQSFSHPSHGRASEGLRAWKNIPAVVCITLKVPRAKLGVFTELPITKLGTPIVHCVLQSSSAYTGKPSQSIFAAVQLAFGTVTTSGQRNSADFRVHVTEDKRGWMGGSPLTVSFYAPTWLVLLEPQNAKLAFGIQSTPQSTMTFAKILGLEMNVYSTVLGDGDHVYITKHLPNQSAYPAVCNILGANGRIEYPLNEAICTAITANVDRETARIVALTGRVDVLSDEARSSLRSQAEVKVIQMSPCVIAVTIGLRGSQYRLHFPAPVLHSQSKTRIARKSSYVEVVAPIASPMDGKGFPHFMYPVLISGNNLVAWNMPYLDLDCLPILDISKTADLQWLITHTSLQFSGRERKLREKSMASRTEVHKDVRINFKDSLFSMFMHFTGLQGRQSRVFGINHPTGGGVHILFFVSCLRLEIANHTAVLDTAVLPLTDRLMPRINDFLAALTNVGICNISVDDDELSLWKEVLPALVERCRQWEHHPSCEYKVKAQIPLSVENGQAPLCSCGNGSFPPRFISGIPKWDLVSKYVVRAAISPSFSVPFVDQIFEDDEAKKGTDKLDSQCRNCGKGKLSDRVNLLRCSRCSDAKYCSPECQRANWKQHKKLCTKPV